MIGGSVSVEDHSVALPVEPIRAVSDCIFGIEYDLTEVYLFSFEIVFNA